jgi:hypothetical protein
VKIRSTKPNDFETAINSLRTESAKLRCLAHLIETQREPESSPLDAEEINLGLAAILGDCSEAVRTASAALEGAMPKSLTP